MDAGDAALLRRAAGTRLLVLDVDGVLTDGRLLYADDGSETKAFHVRDGHGIKLLLAAGIEIAAISGRRSAAVDRRLAELGVRHALTGREDKLAALGELLQQLALGDPKAIACVGDDLPDLEIMEPAGLGIAVADAHPEVLRRADYRCRLPGGQGAVREVCDLLLAARREARR
ncbi:MAG: phenylphosphate carboxylase subunit delta [Gammaproteobacteria bacterium]|nr:MAG: phenylphosphate carboxylase subunit delta [Gammaproteobacteria bacterium]